MSKRVLARRLVLIMATGCLLIMGCAPDPSKGPARAGTDCLPAGEYPRIALLDGLKGWIVAGEPVVEPGPPQRVRVPLRALHRDKEFRVQYRFLFLKPDRIPLDADPDWHYVVLAPRVERFVEANALDEGTVDWRLEVRPAR